MLRVFINKSIKTDKVCNNVLINVTLQSTPLKRMASGPQRKLRLSEVCN